MVGWGRKRNSAFAAAAAVATVSDGTGGGQKAPLDRTGSGKRRPSRSDRASQHVT